MASLECNLGARALIACVCFDIHSRTQTTVSPRLASKFTNAMNEKGNCEQVYQYKDTLRCNHGLFFYQSSIEGVSCRFRLEKRKYFAKKLQSLIGGRFPCEL